MIHTRHAIPITGLFICFVACAQQDFYSSVTNLWWDGPKTSILAIANERLGLNSNDIAGAVLLLEGSFAFGDASSISNAAKRFMSSGALIQTPAFRVQYPLDAFNVSALLDSMPQMTYDEWAQEQVYGLTPHRKMMFGKAWDALRADGWLDATPPENAFHRQEVESRAPRRWRGDDTISGKMIMAYMVNCATKTDENLSSAWTALHGMTDTQMLAVAQQRLVSSSNDLFGATTSLFYHFKRCDPSTMSNAVDRIAALSNEVERVLRVGAAETRSPFAEHWPWMSTYLANVQIWLSGTNAPAFESALHYDDLHPDP